MPDNHLLTAADELERRGEALVGPEADFVISREMAELAAKLRHLARWIDRPQTPGRATTEAVPTDTPADEPLMLTSQQAADRLSMSTRTLSRLVAAGELTPRKWGRLLRFPVAAIEEFATKQK